MGPSVERTGDRCPNVSYDRSGTSSRSRGAHFGKARTLRIAQSGLTNDGGWESIDTRFSPATARGVQLTERAGVPGQPEDGRTAVERPSGALAARGERATEVGTRSSGCAEAERLLQTFEDRSRIERRAPPPMTSELIEGVSTFHTRCCDVFSSKIVDSRCDTTARRVRDRGGLQ